MGQIQFSSIIELPFVRRQCRLPRLILLLVLGYLLFSRPTPK